MRVLKPGGTLHVTTDVAGQPQDILIDDLRYGEASEIVELKTSDSSNLIGRAGEGVAYMKVRKPATACQ